MALAPHVVVVDDDPSILTLLTATLKAGLGAQVTSFTSAEAALEAWPRLAAVALVLTDYSMPGLNGLDFAQRLRSAHQTLPIVVLSAVELPLSAPGTVTTFLSKPCPPRVLLPQLRGLLDLPDLAATQVPAKPSPVATSPAAGISPKMLELKEKYRLHLKSVLTQLPELVEQSHTPTGERALRDSLHQLAGTAGSYGFGSITEAALNLRGALLTHQPLEPAVLQLTRALTAAQE